MIRLSAGIFLFSFFLMLGVDAYTVKGKVFEESERVSVGAEVWLAHSQMGVSKVVTGEGGEFVFKDVPMGEVSIIARDKINRLGGNTFVCVDNVEVRIFLYKGVLQKIRVLNPNLVPLSGAYLRRFWVADAFCVPAEELAESGMGWFRSDDEGIIQLTNMPNRNFIRIVVSHIEYADTYLPFVPVSEGGSIDVIMKKGVIVRGRITHQGKGVEGAMIVPMQKGVGMDLSVIPYKTDRDGFYRMRLGKGEYRLFAVHSQYPNTPPKEISVTDLEEEMVVDFVFMEPLIVEGTVLLPDGGPCKLAKIVLFEPSGMEDFVFTNELGKYILKLNSEQAKMRVIPPPGYMTEVLPEISINFHGVKRIQADPIKLKSLPKMRGIIKLPDGSRAERVLITTKNLEFPFFCITNDEGVFDIQLGYMPEVNPIEFVAEHGLRFLRNEFSLNIFETGFDKEIALLPYEPNQDKFIHSEIRNKMGHLLDKDAPMLQCRTWFNYVGSEKVKLQEAFQGKIVLILFWGGFDKTPFAMMHVEELRALYDLYRGVSDVAILSVHDGMLDVEDVERYVRDYSIEFPVGVDTDSGDTFKNYSIEFIPQMVLIDKRGVLRYTDVSGRTLELIKVLRRSQ